MAIGVGGMGRQLPTANTSQQLPGRFGQVGTSPRSRILDLDPPAAQVWTRPDPLLAGISRISRISSDFLGFPGKWASEGDST